MIKKAIWVLLPLIVILGTVNLLWRPAMVQAAVNHSDLMDDQVFDNYNSMSASAIDIWLDNNFPSSCISTNQGFSAPDPTGYSPSSGFTYGSPVSAGQVIYDAAQAYSINPQVLLTTLQKEQSLVSGGAGCSTLAYAGAMGYGCPDSGTTHDYPAEGTPLSAIYYINGNPVTSVSGTCVYSPNAANKASAVGFSEQVIHGAWLLKFGEQRSKGNTAWAVIKGSWNNSDDPGTCYSGPMTQGTFKRCSSDSSATFYDGYITIDGISTHMDTGATAALYWYTPHFHGNDNFVTFFQQWFGSTIGPDYNWSIDSFSYNNIMGVGQSQTVTLKITNAGRLPWYNQNGNPSSPVRLGTWLPNRQSPFYAAGSATGSWLSPTRPANMVENQVNPGEQATFTFQLTAPTVTGTYVESFNLVFEGYQWLPWAGFSPTIQVVNPYQWQVSSINYGNGTGYMAPGTTQQITVKALNTGTATWSSGSGPPIRLGTWGPERQSAVGNGWISSTRAVSMQEPSVAPGQTGTFTFNVYMPDSGQYYERLNLVAEGVTWFNDPGLTLYLQGQSYAWQPDWVSPSTGNWSIPRNTTFTITLHAHNTGTTTWTKNGSFPIHLGTWPPGRGTALETGGWLSSIRPTGLVENSVAPGDYGTFTFLAKTGSVPGLRYEAFNLVAEGVLWFQDPGFAIYVNVL